MNKLKGEKGTGKRERVLGRGGDIYAIASFGFSMYCVLRCVAIWLVVCGFGEGYLLSTPADWGHEDIGDGMRSVFVC